MLTFFTDETDVQGKDGRQYGLSIYGGMVLDEECFKNLTKFLYKLKESYLFPQELDLKWRFESVWESMKKVGFLEKDITRSTHPSLFLSMKDDYSKIKEVIINEISKSNAKIIIAVRPNKLLGATSEQNIDYSIQAVSRKFEKLLENEGEIGIILADELRKRIRDDAVVDYQYILNLCCSGSNNKAFERLISIVPTIDSCVSPIHQLNDILLGAVQYYILEFMRKLEDNDRNIDIAKGLMAMIKNNFYQTTRGGYIINSGILLYPPKISRKETRAGIFLDKLENQLKLDFNIY